MDKDIEIDDPENEEFMEEASNEWEKTRPENDEFGPSYVKWLNETNK